MTKKTFETFSQAIADMADRRDAEKLAQVCLQVFSRQNPRFNPHRFLDACGFPSIVVSNLISEDLMEKFIIEVVRKEYYEVESENREGASVQMELDGQNAGL